MDKTLYTGITVNLGRRLKEHNSSALGAKYTRPRRPVKLVYSKRYRNRSTASKAEAKIKAMTRGEKLAFLKVTGSAHKSVSTDARVCDIMAVL